MVEYFSAIVCASVTGTTMILEMIRAYDLLSQLMIVSIISYRITEYFKGKPIYEVMMQKDLRITLRFIYIPFPIIVGSCLNLSWIPLPIW
jgi:H+/Cl- antiporter ClcA